MKTLADLKRNCDKYLWLLRHNSWIPKLPSFQTMYRPVGRLQTKSFSLLTDKEGNGEITESWIDFPKSSELFIIPKELDGIEGFEVIITQENRDIEKPAHIMIYHLTLKK